MGSDDEEIEQSPPPIPPRTSSTHPERPIPLPITIDNNGQLIHNDNSDSSNSTSSDAPDLLEDTSEDSSDTDSDDATASNEDKIRGYISNNFDANSSLPPVPNGTLDLTSPADKQKFSSDEERYESFHCNTPHKAGAQIILRIIFSL